MQGIKRRIVFITLYEGLAICASSVLLLAFSDTGLAGSAPLAVATSAVAVGWNLFYNWLFERWEKGRKQRGRGVGRRIAHAIGFEGGLLVILLPLIAWWLGISMLEALVADLGLLAFFLGYTFAFNWAFDRVFGLPTAAA